MGRRVLVTGSNGLLGTKLLGLLLSEADVEPMGVSRAPCSNAFLGAFPFWQADLAADEEVARVFDRARPDIVLHTAAMTDVDGCERAPHLAWRFNVEVAGIVATHAREAGARLVHLSSEYVFDGEAGPYGEDDSPNPLSVYGKTKWASEEAVLGIMPAGRAAIARTTVVFGHARNVRPNFATWLVARLRGGAAAGPLSIVDDQVGSPTLADNLAQMVWALGQDASASGVWNTVGGSVMDRLAFARLIARVFVLDATLIRPTSTAALRQPAPRPLRGGLRMDHFRAHYPHVPVLEAEAGVLQLRAQLDAA